MDYNNFLDHVKKSVANKLGENTRVDIHSVTKNNGCHLDGLIILEEGNNISPTIYLNVFYDRHMNGTPVDELVDDIIAFYRHNRNKIKFDADSFLKFENVRKNIVYKVINYSKNKELLERIPHKRFLDLAVVYYYLIENLDDNDGTILIHNSHMKMWNTDADEIHAIAIKNAPRLLKGNIQPLCRYMGSLLGENIKEEDMPPVYILTNSKRINGASCMLYDNILSDFSKLMDSDLYILPSSIHEVIILPKTDDFDRNILQNMVHEVNCENVAPDEILADHIYEYNRKNGIITM